MRIWTLLVALLLVGGAGVVTTSTVWAQSNEVVVVTSFPKEVFEGYKRAFEGVTPGVKVVIKQQQTNQGVTYLRETRAKPDADVFWVSSVDAFLSLKQDGLLDRVTLPRELAARIPASVGEFPINDPDGTFFGFAVSGYGLMWNTRYCRPTGYRRPRNGWISPTRAITATS